MATNSALELVKQQMVSTRPSFEEMNLNKLSFAKELEYAIQMFEKNDYLLKMNPQSIKNALVNIALSGLSLNPVMKLAYLVPRKGICCVDPSYQGLIKIVTDTGSVKSLKADVAYEKDSFDIQLGSKGYVYHKPYLGADARGRKIGAYSIAVLNDGTEHIDFMRWDEIMAIKARSESVKAGKQSPWDTDPDEMACKTVVKRHWKYLPKSERGVMAATAIDLDNQANGIDFSEQQKAQQAAEQAAATPHAPEIALATEEDLAALIEWLDNENLPDVIFEAEGKKGVNKKAMKTAIEKKFNEGKLAKDKAEEYINGLKAEVDKAVAEKEVG